MSCIVATSTYQTNMHVMALVGLRSGIAHKKRKREDDDERKPMTEFSKREKNTAVVSDPNDSVALVLNSTDVKHGVNLPGTLPVHTGTS